ncbi:MAG: TonB-dependent receptor plug domain-containing protein, partial [Planctomycetota bacterium]
MRDSRIQVPVRSLLIFLSFLVLLFAGQATAWADDGDEAPVVTTEAEPPQTDEPPLVQLPDLPGVVVIGRMLEEGLPEVPIDAVGSRNVFGPAWVQKTGARDLNDLVQQLPAASSRPYNGGEASAPSFSMRGLPDDGLTEYINIQIDGVPASPLPYGWTAFSFLPITIERVYGIDFIRGAYSVR